MTDARLTMTEYFSPLSQNDLIKIYGHQVTLTLIRGSELYEFIAEEHWEDAETFEDCLIRLLTERMSLSRQGH